MRWESDGVRLRLRVTDASISTRASGNSTANPAMTTADKSAVAWTAGRLGADNMRLDVLIATLARYRHSYLDGFF